MPQGNASDERPGARGGGGVDAAARRAAAPSAGQQRIAALLEANRVADVDPFKLVAPDLNQLNGKLSDDHVGEMVLPGYPDYAKNAPRVLLDRAKKKLDKKGFKVAFAGAMKAGKSTLINALVKAPELLPCGRRSTIRSMRTRKKPKSKCPETSARAMRPKSGFKATRRRR